MLRQPKQGSQQEEYITEPMFDEIYRNEDLHLTRQIFSMTDNGIRAVGKF